VDFLESGIFWTGLVGLAGILATIYGSKRQADATLAQIAAERDRQEVQHTEDHRRNRQTTYHLFLTAAAQLRTVGDRVASGTDEERRAAERARWEFLHLLHGVELFRTDAVRDAAIGVTSALEQATNRGRVEIFEAPPGYVGLDSRVSLQALIDLLRDDEVASRMDAWGSETRFVVGERRQLVGR
jgi:hypothetical protein